MGKVGMESGVDLFERRVFSFDWGAGDALLTIHDMSFRRIHLRSERR